MKFDLTLGLVDRPGQLLRALEPLAKNGGNIISIIHEREKVSGGYVPVSLVVDFPTNKNYLNTKRALENMGISIIKSEEIIEKANFTFILIGARALNVKEVSEIETEGARIVDFEVSSPTSKEACAKLNVEVPLEAVDRIVSKLKRMSKMEDGILISSL